MFQGCQFIAAQPVSGTVQVGVCGGGLPGLGSYGIQKRSSWLDEPEIMLLLIASVRVD